MKKFKLNLFLFDGEGSGTAGVATGEGASAEGTQNEAAATPTTDTPATPDLDAEYKELISGKYKEASDKHIQGILNKRFKANKEMETRLSDQGAILDIVAEKYGAAKGDLKALMEAVKNDDSYYEDKAAEEGLTVEQYKRIAQAEAKNRAYEAQLQERQKNEFMQRQLSVWDEQAKELKKVFPDFDLHTELQNETFQKQLQLGIDMQSAYVAAHQAQILSGAMQYTAQAVRKATADDIAARGQRPRENAMSTQAAARVGTDVSKLTRADREALARRAMAGEIINL